MPTLQTSPQILPQLPLVSFIATTYNLPYAMLCECLRSMTALSLGAEEYEIILVDDGSEVSPQEQLEKDIAHPIIYIRQENQGPAAARNAGLEVARGRYVQFVDGDDALIPALYDHCLQFLKKENPDMLVFRHTAESAGGGVEPVFEGPMTGSRYMETRNLRVAVWGYAFRRGSLGGLRFDTAYRSEEDEAFTPRMVLRMERVYEAAAAPYCYRRRPGSLTTDRRRERLECRLENLETILFGLVRLRPQLPPNQQAAMLRRTVQLATDWLYNIVRFTHSPRRLSEAKRRLRTVGLYPLPPAPYGWKYNVFRRLIKLL